MLSTPFHKTVALGFLLLIGFQVFAINQNLNPEVPEIPTTYEVKALVTDSLDNPEPFATFRVLSLPDSAVIGNGVSSEEGLISSMISLPGEYALAVSSVGRAPIMRDFEVNNEQPIANVGQIILTDAGKELKEVVVTAMRPLVSREIDRIGYDVQGDEDSKTSKFNEILNKVPLVSVDPDGTIRVKGSTDFKIYKNGRPNKSLSNNAKELFKSIPATMIKRVEVITEPGAREDAEGTSAILNIVMMENTVTTGIIGNVSLYYSTDKNIPSPNVWLSGQVDKVALNFYGGMYSSPWRSGKSRGEVEATYEQSGDKMKREQKNASNYAGGWTGFEMSWEPDTLNLVSAEFNGYLYNNKSRTDYNVTMFDAAMNPLYSYSQSTYTKPSRYFDFSGAVNYQRSTRKKGEAITLSYLISTTNQLSNDTTMLYDMFNSPFPYTGWNSHFDLNFIEHTAQIDWTRPFGKIHKLDVGGKFIYRGNHSINRQNYVGLMNDTTDYSHNTLIGALYADYRINVGKWGFRAGLRYEFSRLKSEYVDEDHPEYHSNLNDLCPSAAISYAINDRNNLKLNYSTSIQRPGINYLNPAIIIGPLSESHGNPDLHSARNQSLSLNYNYFARSFSTDISTGYSFINDGIIENRTIDTENVVHSTYENNGRTKRFFFNLWMQWRVSSKTSFNINGGLTYNSFYNDNLGISNHGWTERFSIWYTQQLPWKLRLNLGGGIYNYPVSGLYGRSYFSWSNSTYYNINLSRTFLKEDRLTVGISANNPLWAKHQYSHSITTNMPVQWDNRWWYDHNISIGVNISYRFGSMNIQVKKTSASIQNDDLMGRKN